MNTKQFRRSLHELENYHQKTFGHEEAIKLANSSHESSLIQEIKYGNRILLKGNITIKMPKVFGFCWGVERAIQMAYETRIHFPNQRVWIVAEIVHNPVVNQNLKNIKIEFIADRAGKKDFSVVRSDDVVIIPAAGTAVGDMQLLTELGCTIVDTTCPWVARVWNAVEKHKKGEYTSIIHGKNKHDETMGTSSYSGKYLIVQNLSEAQLVCDYILNGGDRNAFIAKFGDASSPNFDPDQNLEKIGIANQTTMLASETEQIGRLFEQTIIKKYTPLNVGEHFLAFNTICNATQERQDAIAELLEQPLDIVLVVGGFNSSNTSHLNQMATTRGIPSYHVDTSDRILSADKIQHRSLSGQIEIAENWLPDGQVTIGVTSGASTPDSTVANVIAKIFRYRIATTELESF
jgi:4-hydroxy-3-methylbut-2-enyl diphosphate reductase